VLKLQLSKWIEVVSSAGLASMSLRQVRKGKHTTIM